MKQYEITKISGTPNWENIPALEINTHLWSHVTHIVPQAKLAWDEEALYVRLEAVEAHILARFTGNTDQVCEDSCLEFFFCPEDSDRYFNFEGNPNGAMYIGFGRPGRQRYRLYAENFGEIFQIKPFTFPGGWGYEMRIPASFVQIYAPEFTLCPGKTIRANFFKCGDSTVEPHWISWNPVEVVKPNFHLPEFFGSLILKP